MPAQSRASSGAPAGFVAPAGEIRLIGSPRRFGRDRVVFCDGDPADHVYKVVAGAVRAVRLLADGRRQISDFYLPGDVFGVELGAWRRSAAETLGETSLLVARRSALTGDPDLGAQLCRLALRELERSRDHVLTLGRRTSCERVASFLVDLAERLDARGDFELPMSRGDMADYLGLTVETVSRALTQLQHHGLIALSGSRRVRLAKPAALADVCG